MAGLVDYGSSDEETHSSSQSHDRSQPDTTNAPLSASNGNGIDSEKKNNGQRPVEDAPEAATPDAPLVGPSLGPTMPLDLPMNGFSEEDQEAPPQSPYSANRALLRQLTLPTVPNYDIPPSPPGSPPPNTAAKMKQFLELKKQGIHFNEKLAKSTALKNPALTQKLMDFAGIDEAGQYGTTLPKELWDPSMFPEHAFKEGLALSQKKLKDEKARGPGEAVNFVTATTSGDAGKGIGRNGQKSAAERIMAGLDRGKSGSPHGVKRKTRFES